MPTSVYFNNYSVATINEQRLLEDVIGESIKIMGHDVYYIPRDSYDGIDQIWGESINATFTRAYTIEAYIANVEGYEGDGDFFSKFGLDIRDTTNIVIAYRAFTRYVPSAITPRPREGDLIYIPVMKKLFEIKFVEEELLFFSLGKRNPYIYELRCDLFRYSSESIDTGVEEIDDVEKDNSYAIKLDLGAGSGLFVRDELVYQGASYNTATQKAIVKEFNPTEKTIELYNIVGEFSVNTAILGVTSNASYTVITKDTLGDYTYYDLTDNKPIQDDAEDVIVVTENNPFGMP